MDYILSELEKSRKKTPVYAKLVRTITLVNEDCRLSKMQIESLTETYFFKVDIINSDHISTPIASLNSYRSEKAPELWVYGPLSNIVSEIELGVIPEIEYEIPLQLKARNATIFNYHPELAHAKIIRQQFFARVRKLEETVTRIHRIRLQKILGLDIERYREEIEKSPDVRKYTHLYETEEHLDELVQEYLSIHNLPQINPQ